MLEKTPHPNDGLSIGPQLRQVPSTRAVIYARVSSEEQEKEGYSIPAQLKLLKDHAAAEGFAVAKEYVDVETAKRPAAVPSARW